MSKKNTPKEIKKFPYGRISLVAEHGYEVLHYQLDTGYDCIDTYEEAKDELDRLQQGWISGLDPLQRCLYDLGIAAKELYASGVVYLPPELKAIAKQQRTYERLRSKAASLCLANAKKLAKYA
jgi:hypothetical protein